MSGFKEKQCSRCELLFIPRGGRQYACDACAPKIKAEKKRVTRNNWNRSNPDKVSLMCKVYRENNREKVRAAIADWHKRHPEYQLKRNRCPKRKRAKAISDRKWRLKNRERCNRLKKKWVLANPEAVIRMKRNWKKNNPTVVAMHTNRRRVRKANAGGSHTEQEWVALKLKCKYRCLCCKKKKPLTRDHIVPLSQGGTDDIKNIQPLCGRCNSLKGTNSTDFR